MAKKIAFFLLLSLPFCFHSVIGQKENQKHSQALFCVTAADGSSLLEYRPVILKSKVASEEITINPEIRYQEMDGFGYTLTGGSAYHLQHMSPDARRKILNELFGNGDGEIGVSYLRLSIGASDLDEKTWSYDDLPEGTKDPELLHFSMAYDTLYLIPTLREILEINPHIKLLGSPWSAPKWMKDNNDTRGGSLLPEYYDAYANYFCK
ncbi:MAG: glucosylceramidase, partial [Bacteroidales bacterium]|nr:glucosylceramidase [Bacteroidales bacterium]